MPGMINAHTHLAMTMFRGLADDRDLAGFLDRLLPAEAAVLDDRTVEVATRAAVAECIGAGITSALDMYFFPEAARRVSDESGFRLHNGPVFIEFPGPDARPFDQRLDWADAYLHTTCAFGSATWVQPHSTYLLDQSQLRDIAELATRHDARIHVHACETRIEIDQVRARHDRTPIEVLAEVGLLTDRTVLAHGVHLCDGDIALIAASRASVTHCPASNFKLASGIARVPELLATGVNVPLGTDGPASGNDLDLWMAMRLAAYVHKVHSDDPTVLRAAEVVAMATINGAVALGIDDQVGSLEVGKRADVVVLDARSPALTPMFDPHSAIAYAAGRADVRSVIIDGRVVLDERVHTTIDLDHAVAGLRALRPQVLDAVS
jgi:5-methylthioadenosine/S-adenosylhomocysteine deaminase